jgi:hypothetical protein
LYTSAGLVKKGVKNARNGFEGGFEGINGSFKDVVNIVDTFVSHKRRIEHF